MFKRFFVVTLILFLAVGYAAISTKLIIDGNVNLAYDNENFNVGITSVTTNYGTYSLTNDKTLNFQTIGLSDANDEALLEFIVANKSLKYDADVSVNCSLKDSSLSEYLSITTDTEESFELTSGDDKSILLTIKMLKQHSRITPDITCALTTTPKSRTIEGKVYKENPNEQVLNGADPVLDAGNKLIPVTLSLDGTVKYADTTKRWYSYKAKSWANAVILVDNPSKTYIVNDTIKESDIESYFVWIPRFKYQIFNTGEYTALESGSKPLESNAKEIQIEFEGKDTEVSAGSKVGDWLTHPAFTNYNTAGLWVGKFETGYAGATDKTSAQQNIIDANKVIIKPNVYSWRFINVSTIFKTSISYEESLNSHMMRNTEWGAVAYLSHSNYGINTEIRINNNANNLTGYAANTKDAEESTTNNSKYNTEIGYLASTTGNISGIYDMNGGAWEFVAGNNKNSTAKSGFTEAELLSEKFSKHIDIYPNNSTVTSFNDRILGDATGEMGPFYKDNDTLVNSWYSDLSDFVQESYPWFARGGSFERGAVAGQFSFGTSNGNMITLTSFRITLSVNN